MILRNKKTIFGSVEEKNVVPSVVLTKCMANKETVFSTQTLKLAMPAITKDDDLKVYPGHTSSTHHNKCLISSDIISIENKGLVSNKENLPFKKNIVTVNFNDRIKCGKCGVIQSLSSMSKHIPKCFNGNLATLNIINKTACQKYRSQR